MQEAGDNALPDKLCVAQSFAPPQLEFFVLEKDKLTSLKWETLWGADTSMSFHGDQKIVQSCFTWPSELKNHTALILLRLKAVPFAHHGKQLSLVPLANKIPSENNNALSLWSDAASGKVKISVLRT